MAIAFARGWVTRFDFTPSVLTLGKIYWSIRNQDPTRVFVGQLRGQAIFTGTTAGTMSQIGLHRKAGTPTGGVEILPTLLNGGSPTGTLEQRQDNAGLSGFLLGTADQFHVVSCPSVAGAVVPIALPFEDENPLMLEQGDCLVLYAHTALVSGLTLSGSVTLYQQA